RNGSDEVSAITEQRPPDDCDVASGSTVVGNCSACHCLKDLLVALHDKVDSLVKDVVSVKAENSSLLLHLSKNTEMLPTADYNAVSATQSWVRKLRGGSWERFTKPVRCINQSGG
ncbi:hypothetical protein HPB47_026233, partial [Ixodes persulcatus]